MTEEQRLIEKLQLIEALFAGAATPGERDAAAHARDRIRSRLGQQQQSDPPVEFTFRPRDRWSHKLLTALLRRYQIRPYRYYGQRHTTIMAQVPERFVKETLWPEYLELNRTLEAFLSEMTDRVISQGIEANMDEVEVEPQPLPPASGSACMADIDAGATAGGDAIAIENRLDIDTGNFWPNRIIGDQTLPPEKRMTRANIKKFAAATPLMESGLLGPVTLRTEKP